jgi:hypothetical protein
MNTASTQNLFGTPILQHTPGHLSDSGVPPFNHSILLWSVRCSELSFDPMFSTKVIEFFGIEFPTTIKPKRVNVIA